MAGPQYSNWLGILKWTLAQGGDGTQERAFKAMSTTPLRLS
jgi:hypothetical protein